MTNFIFKLFKWALITTGVLTLILIFSLFALKKFICSSSLGSCIDWIVQSKDSCQKHEEWTIETTTTPTINVQNIVGSIDIKGHDKDECIIKATKHGASEESLNDVEVATHFSKDKITLKTNTLKKNCRSWISYELTIPHNAICKIKNVTGAITITEMKNSVDADTVTGSLECSLKSLANHANIELEATTGSIKLYLPKDTTASIVAKTTVGSIDSDFPLTFDRTEWTGSSAHGLIGDTASNSNAIKLQVTTGSIDIKKQ